MNTNNISIKQALEGYLFDDKLVIMVVLSGGELVVGKLMDGETVQAVTEYGFLIKTLNEQRYIPYSRCKVITVCEVKEVYE